MRGNEMVDGTPIRVYDNGGKTFDRYTVAYMHESHQSPRVPTATLYDCLGMSSEPFHPQGFGQHSDCMIGQHLGKRIPFARLPKDCQQAVHQDTRAISAAFREVREES